MMHKTRNKRKLFLLAVLTIVTVAVFWWIQPENRIDIDQQVFQVEDLSRISRVDLESDSASVSLSYDGGRWRVNDSLSADANMIRVLFATLQQARPKRRASNARQDSIYASLEENGVTVSLYENDQLIKQFVAGGNAAKTVAYFADPRSGEVYVMTIPGYRVYVSGILELPANGWRDKFVFNFNWRNFKSLQVRFPETPNENFTVSMQKDFFGIEGMADADTSRLNTYLDEISLLAVDEYVSEPALSDSLTGIRPELDVIVTDIGNRTYRLRLFETRNSRRVFGVVQAAQVAIFNQRKIQPLIKPKSFFRKK
jgi:hypothetical protein